MKSGALTMSRMVMLVMVMSSQQRAVDGLEREAVAALEDAVGDGDVVEAAVGFGAALDAAGVRDDGRVGRELLVGAVEHGAELVAAGDVAVGDGDVLAWRGRSRARSWISGRCRRPTAS